MVSPFENFLTTQGVNGVFSLRKNEEEKEVSGNRKGEGEKRKKV